MNGVRGNELTAGIRITCPKTRLYGDRPGFAANMAFIGTPNREAML